MLGEAYQLTNTKGRKGRTAFSPSGIKRLFTSVELEPQLVVIDVEKGRTEKYISEYSAPHFNKWLNEETISFTARISSNRYRVLIIHSLEETSKT